MLPGHTEISGNKETNLLGRHNFICRLFCGVGMSTQKKGLIHRKGQLRASFPAKLFLGYIQHARSKGHARTNPKHMTKIGLKQCRNCRVCRAEDENSEHSSWKFGSLCQLSLQRRHRQRKNSFY